MLETIRDVAIIIVAILDIILISLLALIAFFVFRLFMKVKSQVPPLLDTAQSTATSVKGTTNFVGEAIVTPLVRLIAFLAAAAKFLSVLFGGERRRV